MNRAVARLASALRDVLGDVRILLFGSRARGDHLFTSDVDLLVISPRFAGMRDDDRMVLVLEQWSGPVALQPLCFTPQEFEERRNAISIVQVAAREARAVG